jgi:hypothetical protein
MAKIARDFIAAEVGVERYCLKLATMTILKAFYSANYWKKDPTAMEGG